MTLSKDDIETLATGAGQSPTALFAAVHEVAARRVGAGLVTVMRHRATEADVERLWSSKMSVRAEIPAGAKYEVLIVKPFCARFCE